MSLMNTRPFRFLTFILLLFLVISLLAGACQPRPPAPVPDSATPAATASAATPQAVPPATQSLPPVVASSIPPRNAELALDGAVVLTFDQPMDEASTVAAFAVDPPTPGETVLMGNTLTWTPAEPLTRAAEYRITLAETATAVNGLALNAPFELPFRAVGFLQVAASQPISNSKQVDVASPITVIFNRPVVALTGVDDATALPDVLEITPATPGKGHWLNTSIYSFVPDSVLSGDTAYRVTVPAGLTDVSGNLLAAAYAFTFTTDVPMVVSTLTGDESQIWPTKPITVTFSQPMERTSTEEAFLLRRKDTQARATGRFTWSDGDRTVRFQPGPTLAYDTDYELSLSSKALSAAGDAALRVYSTRFHTVPQIALLRTNPADKDENVPVEDRLDISFQGIVDEESLGGASITILPTPTEVYSYFNSYDGGWTVSWPRQPETTYTVTLSSQIADVFGNTISPATIHFKTAIRNPFAHLNVPNEVGTYNAYNATSIAVSYRNISRLDFTLSRVSEADVEKMLGGDGWDMRNRFRPGTDALLRKWSVPVTPERNSNALLKVPLAEDGGPLPAGLYWIELRAPEVTYDEANNGKGQSVPRHLLLVSPLNLILKRTATELLVWATDLRSGQPVADLPVRIGASNGQGGAGTTDANGLLRSPLAKNDPWIPVVAFVGDPESASYGIASSDWQSGLASWDFGLSSEIPPAPYQGYFYSDRPIYRPGQTIHWRGVLRVDEDAVLRVPEPGTQVSIIIYNQAGEEIYSAVHETNTFGTLNGDLPLAAEAGLGFYSLEAELVDWPINAVYQPYFGLGFQVAEYRKPEFTVALTPARTQVLAGDMISATVSGEYFFGGGLSLADVSWSVFSEDAYFSYTGNSDNNSPWYSFNDYTGWDPTTRGQYAGVIANGEGRTNADGQFAFVLPADISDRTVSQLFRLDATITDLNNQESAASSSVVVHKGLVYPGVAPRRYVAPVNQPAVMDFITVDWDSRPVPQQTLTVVVSEAEWLSVQKKAEDGHFYWVSEVKTTPVLTDTVTTDSDGQAEWNWTPARSGQYKITATVVDSKGNAVTSAAFMWISDRGSDRYAAWPLENNDRIELVADKPLYEVGDTAQVLIPHPYNGPVRALITTERGEILSTEVITLTGNSETVEIPVTEALLPNAFVSVVIVKGGSVGDRPQQSGSVGDQSQQSGSVGDQSQQSGSVGDQSQQSGSVGDQPQQSGSVGDQSQVADEPVQPGNDGLGSFKLGLVQLAVDTAPRAINITLTPNQPELRPGAVVTFTVQATDSSGEPLQTELSLALIDKAILSLAEPTTGSLLNSFYRQRGLSVVTASTLVLNLDRLNQQLQEGAKGGGGGGGDAMGAEIRTNFQDTALWDPQVVTDENGEAEVSVKLPDDLTTWQLDAIGVTIDSEVGQATAEIRTSLPLLVRPVLPRFLTAGDQAQIGAVVMNNTDDDRTLSVTLDGGGLATDTPLSQIIAVPAHQQAKVTWETTVPLTLTNSVTVTLSTADNAPAAGSTPLRDAAAFSLPVQRYITPETVATAGSVGQSESRTEVVALPDAADTAQGELRLRLEPSLAAATLTSLRWLEHFPYQCNEQIVSKFLPNIATYQAQQTLGLEDAALQTALESQIARAVQQLLQRQNSDGGWGWVPSDQSRPFVSSYVVYGLVRARAAGFALDTTVMSKAIAYLRRTLAEPSKLEGYALNQQAFTLLTLAQANLGDVGRTTALYEQRARLATYGKAWLALTLAELGDEASTKRSRELINDLAGSAVVSATGAHWEEEGNDWMTMNTDLRSTALVLDVLARLDPDNALAPNAVRWLMSQRQDGRWATTQENVWSLIALTDWMAASGELQADYSYTATLNQQLWAEGTVTRANVAEPLTLRTAVADLLRTQANGVTLTRSATDTQSGDGRLYYSLFLDYFLPAAEVEARARGIVVAQQYHLMDPVTRKVSARPITSAKVGDIIQVKVTLVAPTTLHYLLVESPMPAGAEAIDPSLANTSLLYDDPELRPVDRDQPLYWWQPTAIELRDEKAALFATTLPAGTYEYTYLLRASLPGRFQVLPAVASEMYFPEVWGRSAGAEFVITQE